MITNIPEDLKAEVLLNYLPRSTRNIQLCGTHKRNTYRDILEIEDEKKGIEKIFISKDSIYDILPEGLFHPIDRFENIPANEYAERFAEECAEQEKEEKNARAFFKDADEFLEELNCIVAKIRDTQYSDASIICNIILDNLSERYKENKYIMGLLPFIPITYKIRGDRTMITLILRKIFKDEEITMTYESPTEILKDQVPRYKYCVDQEAFLDETFLGNQYSESIIKYTVYYWNEDECDDKFLDFVSEIKCFEDFCNDYFAGIETKIEFCVSNDAPPVRLSDELCYNYLNYNTNI